MPRKPPADAPGPGGPEPPTSKGAATRQRILDAALALFRKEGYEAATMRAIAARAGVATSHAYYYFPSKDHLVHAFYAEVNREHREAAKAVLAEERDLGKRLAGVLRAQIDVFEPYHEFARVLFRTAGDPGSPLNPFSEDSRPVRELAIGVMAEVVSGAKNRIPKDLRPELPELLWVYEAGIVLFWVHDTSEGRTRTYQLIDRSTELVTRIIALSSLPLMGPIRRGAIAMVREALGKGAEGGRP